MFVGHSPIFLLQNRDCFYAAKLKKNKKTVLLALSPSLQFNSLLLLFPSVFKLFGLFNWLLLKSCNGRVRLFFVSRFDRDWKKIEDFVGSKTVIQIRSHAQKYFLKIQKNGTIAHVPPPRPKRKAAHPYPQKASKAALMPFPASMAYPSSVSTLPPGYASWDKTSMLISLAPGKTIAFEDEYTILHGAEGVGTISSKSANSLGNPGGALQSSVIPMQGKQAPMLHGLPDFKEVYSFIGSIFDPGTTGLSQKLKEMDPINHETVLLLMKNLTLNMISPDYELYSKALISHEANANKVQVAAENQMSDIAY